MGRRKIKPVPQQDPKPYYTAYRVTAIYSYKCKAAIIKEDTDVIFRSRKMADNYFAKVWNFYQKAVEEGKLVSFERCAIQPIRFGTF